MEDDRIKLLPSPVRGVEGRETKPECGQTKIEEGNKESENGQKITEMSSTKSQLNKELMDLSCYREKGESLMVTNGNVLQVTSGNHSNEQGGTVVKGGRQRSND